MPSDIGDFPSTLPIARPIPQSGWSVFPSTAQPADSTDVFISVSSVAHSAHIFQRLACALRQGVGARTFPKPRQRVRRLAKSVPDRVELSTDYPRASTISTETHKACGREVSMEAPIARGRRIRGEEVRTAIHAGRSSTRVRFARLRICGRTRPLPPNGGVPLPASASTAHIVSGGYVRKVGDRWGAFDIADEPLGTAADRAAAARCLGSRVGFASIHAFDVTPTMRISTPSGQPLFSLSATPSSAPHPTWTGPASWPPLPGQSAPRTRYWTKSLRAGI